MISLLLAWGCAPDGAAEGARDPAPTTDEHGFAADTGAAGEGADGDPAGEQARPGIPGVPDVPDLWEESEGAVDEDEDEDEDDLVGDALHPPLPAPTFSVFNQHGEVRVGDDLLGAPTALWFFRDTASSCTNDACGYRDLQDEFDALGMRIVAVGPTPPEANAAWAASLDYAYEIWSDTDGALIDHYGVESGFDEGPLRHAFILDGAGEAQVFHEGSVSIGAAPAQVLADGQVLFGGDG